MFRRPLRAGLVVAGLIAAAAVVIAVVPGGSNNRSRSTRASKGDDCPAGFVRENDGDKKGEKGRNTGDNPLYSGPSEPAEKYKEAHGGEAPCQAIGHPESFADLSKVNSQLATRKFAPGTELKPGAYEHGLRQRDALAQKNTIEGDDGLWTPYGSGPMISNNTDYDQTNGSTKEGFVDVAGRTNDFARDSAGNIYAAVAFGGVWKSSDQGKNWTSIGDNLPTQVTASVDWSPADGGTLLVLTGDHAFGGSSVAGLGVYRTTDSGTTWTKSTGAPTDVLGFQVRVDPTNPSVVYAATGAGLWRSTDAGKTFEDTKLPTGCKVDCFLANMVTDVVIQGPGNAKTPGSKPGAVMAAVGWRGGAHPNVNGNPQSPGNGLYVSDDGAPGSFKTVDTAASGFGGGRQDDLGRVELGIATGPEQNHRIVYALVQDAGKFNGDDPDDLDDVPTTVTGGTVLKGLYVTKDFGKTWTLVEDVTELTSDPLAGSALEPAGKALGYEPGIQAWYNQWVEPDPTRATATGVPSRLFFGLEEIWQSDTGALQQDNGVDSQTDSFHVIGRYWNSCAFLVNGLPKCGPGEDAGNTQPNTTTTHPDQHGALLIPSSTGGVTLIAGNDGGVYQQSQGKGAEFDNNKWGDGSNGGFNTLLPYDAEMAKDGTVYAGLQDNGQQKIQPDGKSYEVFGGDAFFSPVDPDNSNIAYEEYTGGAVQVTTDGGRNWKDINPSLTGALFSTPIVMDRGDAKHLMIGGREVKETDKGPDTAASGGTPPDPNEWKTVYDLGTQKHRGAAGATADDTDPNNQLSAVDLRGDSAYVGFCGYCDTITQPISDSTPFDSGIATNVGGDKPGKRMTGDGWHIARAGGLPKRYVTSLAIDPNDPKTVYATLAGYGRRWAKPGAVGDDVSRVGTGHVFKSTDAGETFKDISADIPDVPANWVIVRGGQLVVGTDVGPFISESTDGGRWAVLGGGIPNVPVFHLQLKPGDDDTLVAATYGRGVYTYTFPKPGTAGPACVDKLAPVTTLTKKGVRGSKRNVKISGTSKDLGCNGKLRRVYVSLALVKGRTGCRSVDRKGRVAKKKTSCRRPKLLLAEGTARWSITIPARRLPRGRLYRAVARGVDAGRHKERPAKKRNQVLFRLRG